MINTEEMKIAGNTWIRCPRESAIISANGFTFKVYATPSREVTEIANPNFSTLESAGRVALVAEDVSYVDIGDITPGTYIYVACAASKVLDALM